MVQISEVLRHFLNPVEKKLKIWEKAPGMKGKFSRWFRIGKIQESAVIRLARVHNTMYMMLYYFTQRPWGPIYKRMMGFDMQPGKVFHFFAKYRLFMLFWFGNNFIEDFNSISMMKSNEDYLAYFSYRYKRGFKRNTLNWRTSAHYIEINRIYSIEMSKKLVKLENEMWEEHQRKKALNLTN